MKIISLILLMFMSVSMSKALECVPLTFEQLSYYIHSPVSYDTWMKELMPEGHPAELDVVYLGWNKLQPNHKLICIWEREIFKGSYPFTVLDDPLRSREPYIWIGQEFKSLLPNQNRESNCHCGLVFFEGGKIILITTMSPRKVDSSDIFVQELTADEFWAMTFYIFEITNNPRE
jgi:hypothetical protein